MSKKCTVCGSELNDDDVVCTNCGAKQESAPAASSSSNSGISEKAKKFAGKTEDAAKNYIKKAQKDPKVLAVGIGAVAIVLVLLILIISLIAGSGAYKKAIGNYIDATFRGKENKIEKCAPDEYWDYIKENSDIKISDVTKNYKDEYYEDLVDALEEEYGSNLKFNYKITDKDEVSEKILDEIKDSLKANYDIQRKKVTKAYELEIEIKIKGKDDDDTNDAEMIVAKIDGKWYALTPDYDFAIEFLTRSIANAPKEPSDN